MASLRRLGVILARSNGPKSGLHQLCLLNSSKPASTYTLTCHQHVSNGIRQCYYGGRALRVYIRPFLTTATGPLAPHVRCSLRDGGKLLGGKGGTTLLAAVAGSRKDLWDSYSSSTSGSTAAAAAPPPPGPTAGEFSVKTMKYTFLVLGVMFSGITGFLLVQWGAPPIDEQGNMLEDEFTHLPSWQAYAQRFWRELHYYDKMIKEPSREKLLPDPLTEPYYQPPYTVVLEMTGVLVHPDWTYKTGWRFKKRPAVDYFLQQISPPLYETVIYTAEQGFTAFPILDTLDPQGRIMYRLFRDATRYVRGHHVKDLSCLNRDMTKVIFIDWNEKSFSMQPENALKLKKWSGNDDDRTLIDLAAFLRTIATSEVDDVRSVLAFYKQFDDPIEAFKQNQKRLEEEQQKTAVLRGENPDRRSSWTANLFKRWQ